MMKKQFLVYAVLASAVSTGSATKAQILELDSSLDTRFDSQRDFSVLFAAPSEDTMRELRELKAVVDAQRATSGFDETDTPGFDLAQNWSSEFNEPPVAISDQMLIRVHPEIGDQLPNLIAEYELRVFEVYEGLGAVAVQVPENELTLSISSATTYDSRLKSSIGLANFFLSDPRVLAATPNAAALGSQQASDVPSLEEKFTSLTPQVLTFDSLASETIDWGISDIQADVVWPAPGQLPGVTVGVIDVGFSLHEDITFNGSIAALQVDDHGNHVAGIMCAKHNGLGVKGVLPECQVVAKTGNFLPIINEGDDTAGFFLTFSQILVAMNDFVVSRDDVLVFNASLGYNWNRNFSLNPSDPDNGDLRALVQSQAFFLFPVLDVAQRRDIAIFSAAGNDSSANVQHLAEWASPFNWAAKTACDLQRICSGVVVEAHDNTVGRNRAVFSNVGGHISCPGVEVLSTLARNSGNQPDTAAYGRMSGTSMASPYCAAGYALFRLLRPNLNSNDALSCLTTNSRPSATGAPQMQVSDALDGCPS